MASKPFTPNAMISRDRAKKKAIEICEALKPYVEVINIAGSIRRGKFEVKDIEILCIPKMVPTGSVSLFGEDDRKLVPHAGFVKNTEGIGKVIKGSASGRYMQVEVKLEGPGAPKINVDFFFPRRDDYYRQYAIRTGSAEYTAKVIAAAWVKLGWCGTSDGLRKREECYAKDIGGGKTKWLCVQKNPTLPPAWASEREFFDWLGVQYIPANIRFVT
jgi:DNA polymerase/3'-5' exonuclease PolX